ncbi:MAG: AarF/ABC1/UbiB kinase family protein [Acidobacteriota bacterium]
MSVARPSLARLFGITRVILGHGSFTLLSSRYLAPVVQALPRSWARGHRRRAELSEPVRMRMLFEALGGSFLKLGQMLALQPDVLPPEYCDALYDLLDRVPPVSTQEVERVVAQELGDLPGRLFDHFESKPLASASIGQVHVAWLRGQKLAVKVQRPAAAREFGGDCRILELLAGLIEGLRLERFRFLVGPIREVVEWTRDELDYRREAQFLTAMGRCSESRPHQTVPRVSARLSSRRVLTMEFLDGVSLLDYLRAVDAGDRVTLRRLAGLGFDPEVFAIHVIENFLEQSFVDGVFHADLHPANLMILPGNTVGYLDLGITGTLGVSSRRHLATMTLAYTRGDTDGMCRAFGSVSEADEEALELYRQGLEDLAEDWYERSGVGLRLRKSVSSVMLDMLRLSAETEVWAQRDVIKFIRSSVATDGLIARCAPQVDVGHHLGRACRRHMADLLGGPAAGPGGLLAGWLKGSAAEVGDLIRGGRQAVDILRCLRRGEAPPLAIELVPPSPSAAGVPGPQRLAGKPSPIPTAGTGAPWIRPREVALLLVALGLLAPSGMDASVAAPLASSFGAGPFMLMAFLILPFLRRRGSRPRRRPK